jgi:excisionase family DNA binding protein
MTAALRELEHQTLLPPEPGTAMARELAVAHAFFAAQRSSTRPARLVGPAGDSIDLPDGLYTVLRGAVDALLSGQGVTIAPTTALLSTQEAADLLGVSRPTLVKLLEDGEIPFEQSGRRRHRRVRLADVEAYRRRSRQSRRKALREITQDADEDGLYDTGSGFVATR